MSENEDAAMFAKKPKINPGHVHAPIKTPCATHASNPEPKQTMRRAVLSEAADLVDGDRNAQYGNPNQDFARTALFWSTYIQGVIERKAVESGRDPDDFYMPQLDTWDVAQMMTLLKISRSTVSPDKRDTYVDIAGYAACGADCAETTLGLC